MVTFTKDQVNKLNLEITTAEEAIQWTSDNLCPDVAKASSFGAEDAVVTDMMLKINPKFRLFTLDTGRLPQETYDAIDQVRKRYGVSVEVLFPDATEVEEMVTKKGMNLFYDSIENRKLCCNIRKVNPMNRKLATLDGWITGLRHEQTVNRREATMFELDENHNKMLKINPIINWTWEQIQEYIKKYEPPCHSLLNKGYPSIGCAPCTRPIRQGQDLRAGRWWWEQKGQKECGLHITPHSQSR